MNTFTPEEISTIVDHALIAMLWSAGEITDSEGEPTLDMWDELYTKDDATPELRAAIVAELEQWEDVEFYGVAKHDEMTKALGKYAEHFGDMWCAQFGHDMALTRNHHGAGFWDRGLGEAGDVLTDWAHSLGELNVFHGYESDNADWEGKFHAE